MGWIDQGRVSLPGLSADCPPGRLGADRTRRRQNDTEGESSSDPYPVTQRMDKGRRPAVPLPAVFGLAWLELG
jgi:hypothetical protein